MSSDSLVLPRALKIKEKRRMSDSLSGYVGLRYESVKRCHAFSREMLFSVATLTQDHICRLFPERGIFFA